MSCLRAAPLLVLGLSAGPALADLTAEDVWQNWQGQISQFGYEVTGTPQPGARGLVIPDLGLTQDLPDEGGRIEMRMGRIEMVETGDGRVEVLYPSTMPMAVAITPDDDEPLTAVVTLSQDGLSVIASGSPEALDYDYTARSIRLEVGAVAVGGAPVENLIATLSLADVGGRSSTQRDGGLRRVEQSLASGTVGYRLSVTDAETGSVLDLAGEAETMRHESRVASPADGDLSDMTAALEAGLDAETSLVFGPGATRFSFVEDDEAVTGNSRSDSVRFGGSFSADGFVYESDARGIEVSTELEMFPTPVTYAIERAFLRFALPVAQREEMQDFGLSIDLAGLQLPEMLWSLIDPEATLPRDPAELALDLSGKARLTTDIFDEAQIAALERSGESPGDLESLSLDRLALSVAGARLTGAGAIALENAEGLDIPPAEGSVDLRLEGGQTLLDRLVAIGLLPEDQAMTVRMMASMFANAVEGEDTLTSRIEIRKDGTIMVNGQRMR